MRSSKSAWHVKDVSKGARDVKGASKWAQHVKGASTRSSKEAQGARAVCMRSRGVGNTSMKARSEGDTSKRCSRVREDEDERLRTSQGLKACSKMTESKENEPPYCPNDPLSTNATVDHLSRHEASLKTSHQPAIPGHTNVDDPHIVITALHHFPQQAAPPKSSPPLHSQLTRLIERFFRLELPPCPN
ncbi:hypothetical protein PISMIDRAFT_16697 [Pisolithus microcarpus 441]|uniref:Uncharacterized protein n=1 Tax=Pisolithus microcarpus 441 TaxID=765257 RepID=A0A0C9YEY1_9AGAM|nr:hypothetical protein BKA83DRAFT_16697 [Pisolithus microcarpus]KIK15161.1 hypothetical protein PISMIDRAFT_16697 [Pisolithus microcarpus 441]